MKTIVLTISTDYVSHWGIWEAVRELLQNALDAKAKGFEMEVMDTWVGDVQRLSIRNSGPGLDRQALLLGQSTKRGDDSQIGQFGEGFKLALLVLCRLGHKVVLFTSGEAWVPFLEHSDEFGCDVLKIRIEDGPQLDGVAIEVEGANLSQINLEYRPDLPLSKPIRHLPGQVFINGLFVCKVEGFKFGYNFPPGVLELDRDRGMVDGFNLAYQTSKIWTDFATPGEFDDGRELSTLIEAKALDVQYVEYHVPKASKVETVLVSSYTRSYGNAIPVSTQAEIQQAVASGKKFQLVPEALKNILWRAVGFFIPTVGTPKQRLEAWAKKVSLSQSQRAELDEILASL